MNNDFLQVFVSCETRQQAKSMVDSLLHEQIIACAQILPQMESFYRWQGQIESACEFLLILKTQQKHLKAIEMLIKQMHSYETPEIIAVPIVDGLSEYLNWIENEVM
ncbi:MAG: divalent-cation tolerance protein CutA [Marinicella sp.]|nr:divalent-cation tolerance protein CutA [Xanthomonadales bacterium]